MRKMGISLLRIAFYSMFVVRKYLYVPSSFDSIVDDDATFCKEKVGIGGCWFSS